MQLRTTRNLKHMDYLFLFLDHGFPQETEAVEHETIKY